MTEKREIEEKRKDLLKEALEREIEKGKESQKETKRLYKEVRDILDYIEGIDTLNGLEYAFDRFTEDKANERDIETVKVFTARLRQSFRSIKDKAERALFLVDYTDHASIAINAFKSGKY